MLATALELIDRDGVDALSMRRLAAALGRDPMILYRHAPAAAQRIPLLRSLAHALASYDGATELERGLDILLTGLAATLPPPT